MCLFKCITGLVSETPLAVNVLIEMMSTLALNRQETDLYFLNHVTSAKDTQVHLFSFTYLSDKLKVHFQKSVHLPIINKA